MNTELFGCETSGYRDYLRTTRKRAAIYMQGRAARQEEKPLGACPYPARAEDAWYTPGRMHDRDAWVLGWREGELEDPPDESIAALRTREVGENERWYQRLFTLGPEHAETLRGYP